MITSANNTIVSAINWHQHQWRMQNSKENLWRKKKSLSQHKGGSSPRSPTHISPTQKRESTQSSSSTGMKSSPRSENLGVISLRHVHSRRRGKTRTLKSEVTLVSDVTRQPYVWCDSIWYMMSTVSCITSADKSTFNTLTRTLHRIEVT